MLQKQTELSHLTVRHLFEGLLLYPLLQLRAPPREPVVVVLDGLDHCDGGSREDGPSVAELLPRWLAYLPPWLRFVVTFAPGSPVRAGRGVALLWSMLSTIGEIVSLCLYMTVFMELSAAAPPCEPGPSRRRKPRLQARSCAGCACPPGAAGAP